MSIRSFPPPPPPPSVPLDWVRVARDSNLTWQPTPGGPQTLGRMVSPDGTFAYLYLSRDGEDIWALEFSAAQHNTLIELQLSKFASELVLEGQLQDNAITMDNETYTFRPAAASGINVIAPFLP